MAATAVATTAVDSLQEAVMGPLKRFSQATVTRVTAQECGLQIPGRQQGTLLVPAHHQHRAPAPSAP